MRVFNISLIARTAKRTPPWGRWSIIFCCLFYVSLEALSSSAAGSSDSPLAGLARGGVGVVSPLSRSPEIVERFFSARPNRPDALGCPDALDRNAKEYFKQVK